MKIVLNGESLDYAAAASSYFLFILFYFIFIYLLLFFCGVHGKFLAFLYRGGMRDSCHLNGE